MLNSIKVSDSLSDTATLFSWKKNISTNYIFCFASYGFSDGYGTCGEKTASGCIIIKKFFPMTIYHADKTVDISLFGCNTENKEWSRRYMLSNTKLISITPVLELEKMSH